MIFTILVTLLFKKIGDCENINSVNPLYLMTHSATGYFNEKYGKKYLVLDSIEKYDEVFSGIKKKCKQLTVEKSYFMKKTMLELE